MSYLAPTQERSNPPSGQDSQGEEESSTRQLTLEELSAIVEKMNRDKERDRRTIKELKAQLENSNQTSQLPVQPSAPPSPRPRQSEAPSYASLNKGRSAKLPDPDKLSDGLDPDIKFWVLAMEGKIRSNRDHSDIWSIYPYIFKMWDVNAPPKRLLASDRDTR